MIHSPIGGSNAHIWVKCLAFVRMCAEAPPEEPTQDAADGNASHEIGADLIAEAVAARTPEWSRYDGRTDAAGTAYTEEMFEVARLYAEDVRAVMRKTATFTPCIEQLTPASRIHDAAFGTSDCSLYDRRDQTLYLWDYKYGHRYVDEFENWQAIFYFTGLLDHYEIDGYDDQALELEFRLVQPRCYQASGSIRIWRTIAADIRGQINQLRAAAAKQFKPDSPATPGPHCRDCPARTICIPALDRGFELYDAATRTTDPHEMPPSALGLQLMLIREAQDALKMLDTAYTARVESLIRNSQNVPGWGVKPTYGHTKWAIPVQDVIAVGQSCGVDISKPGAKTPRQAIQAGMPGDVVNSLTETPKTGTKIVPVESGDIRKIFNQTR